MAVEVSVVVPARDAAATLPALLDALAGQRGAPGFDVTLVDDGSRDATATIAEAHPAVTRVVRLDAAGGRAGAPPAGPGAARNAGVAASAGPLIAFTDADCVPAPDWLARLAAISAGADLVQGRVVPERPPGPFARTVSVEGLSPLFETANLAIARELFEQLGGFEPWLSPRRSKELGEDVWLGWRARRRGARVAFAADARVTHAVFERTAREHVAERLRLVFFPAMARRIPELREALFWRRVFLNRRTAAFDAAVLGVLAAGRTRRATPLLAAVPYARMLRRDAAPLVGVAADAAGALGLLAGSLKARRLVV